MSPQDQKIEVTVVVSAQPGRIRVNLHQKLEHLVHEALKRSGNEGQAPLQLGPARHPTRGITLKASLARASYFDP